MSMCMHVYGGHSYEVCVGVREQPQVWILYLPLVRGSYYLLPAAVYVMPDEGQQEPPEQ